MENIYFLIFRRMRRPLLTLLLAHAVAVLGMTLIPGQDDLGNPWRMDFFHAFYFVSFMSTTIGFGEIPYAFTDGQRLWVTFSLYLTVITWLYAIGTLLSLLQDKTFLQAITESRFRRRVRQLREAFYLVCGYGETGSSLVRALTERGRSVVAIDIDPDRANMLQLEDLRQFVPSLRGDASRPHHLLQAGLNHPLCQGVVALTNVNEVNLKVAITSKLLHPEIRVICRSDSHDVEANMASFGTDYIINPFDTFANHLAVALQCPGLYLLQEWLSGADFRREEPVYPPASGRWIVCGYGRFGKAICDRLRDEQIEPVVIEAHPEMTGMPESGYILGRGTEAKTLVEADIDNAVGLVAGTDNDANNLSIIMTARELNPKLFIILRQNQKENRAVIEAINADMVMQKSAIIADHIRVLLGTPLLYRFTSLARHESNEWACELVSRISAVVDDRQPDVWEVRLDADQAHAVSAALTAGRQVRLEHLSSDPRVREQALPCVALLLRRGNQWIMLPKADQNLKSGDHLLFCGHPASRDRMSWCLQNSHAMNYILTGESASSGWLWGVLRRFGAGSPRKAS